MLQSLNSRNQALAKYGTTVHCSKHSCQCHPAELYHTLNGVSSNAIGGLQSAEASSFRELFDQLDDLAASDDRGEIMLLVSTVDGLFTNSHHIVSLFSPYSSSLNLTYVVYEPESTVTRYFPMSEIISTLLKIQNKLHVDNEADTVLLAREWALVSLGKLVQSQGKNIVRHVVHGRNVADITDTSNATGPMNMEKHITTQPPGVRVYRYFRTGGTEQIPEFAPSEEKRQP